MVNIPPKKNDDDWGMVYYWVYRELYGFHELYTMGYNNTLSGTLW
jgi:hypothetical protein